MTGDRGSATIGILMVVAWVAVALIGVGAVAVLYGARVEAANAADAAALAAAVATYPPAGGGDPEGEARRLAGENGASLVGCDCPVDGGLRARVVTVMVATEVSVPFFGELTVRAGARAEFDPLLWLGG